MTELAQKMYFWTQFTEEDFDTLLSWHPGVHKLEGVSLPREVEYTLSLNLKYLFPQPRRGYVVTSWFNAMVRKAKIAYIFRNKPRNDVDGLPGVPFVKNPSWEPTINKHWFKQGVEAGRRTMQLQSAIPIPEPPAGQSDLFRQVTMTPKALLGWLSEHQYLCFISDKNLGIVVVTQDWYWGQIKSFLDLPIFESFIGKFSTFRLNVCADIGRLNYKHKDLEFWLSDRVRKFIGQCHERRDIPQFHGIPKIHKKPWKIRPIVPMHSYVTSTLAVVMHNLLLPIQRACSWICESSRDLCEEVETFNMRGKMVRIHTGDVASMYTAIPWTAFRVALASMVHWYPAYNGNEVLEQWILEAAKLLWDNTVFQLGNRLWHQTDGVPMGIHCGPVFANLYLAFYEKHYLQNFDGLYRRYIDDIFVLHPDDDVVSDLIQAPGMKIAWAHSDVGLSFLDAWFHLHQGSTEVCFRPFEKALNHHQYLPWRSSHPLSVKKGMVKGELTRCANICYRESYFKTWKAAFLQRLIKRGWPRQAVHNWGRQVHFHRKRADFGTARARSGDYIIAISRYNPAWNSVSSTDIWQSMLTTWRRCAPASNPLSFPQHCIVSKKRTKSLWDVVRSVNRSLLHVEYEETHLEDVQLDLSSMDLDDELSVQAPVPFGGFR